MELLYRGFDGLDVSFKGHIDHDFCRALEVAKIQAQTFRTDAYLEWRGIPMMVKESGARGGYAFIASTGMFGATWFFKRPHTNDPWGVRVSCSSFQLALHGLNRTRSQLYETLACLGIMVVAGDESIGRVDYALDYLAPDFHLVAEQFIMHSNASRSDHIEAFDVRVAGASGRTTSVTVGKMPGRQIIVYDKRAEIISKRKPGWWEIWNEKRASQNLPPLERTDRTKSQVWRVELRAGKQHLNNIWGIRHWPDLEAQFGHLATTMLDAVRYVEPNEDSNRARWPIHDLWRRVGTDITESFAELDDQSCRTRVRSAQRFEQEQILFRQVVGLTISLAGLNQISPNYLSDYIRRQYDAISSEIDENAERYAKKLEKAHNRYRFINSAHNPHLPKLEKAD